MFVDGVHTLDKASCFLLGLCSCTMTQLHLSVKTKQRVTQHGSSFLKHKNFLDEILLVLFCCPQLSPPNSYITLNCHLGYSREGAISSSMQGRCHGVTGVDMSTPLSSGQHLFQGRNDIKTLYLLAINFTSCPSHFLKACATPGSIADLGWHTVNVADIFIISFFN